MSRKYSRICFENWLTFIKNSNKSSQMVEPTRESIKGVSPKTKVSSLPKFLYLDDEDVQATVDRLNNYSHVQIEVRDVKQSKGFESDLDSFDFQELDGIILDYRLDVNKEGGGVSYKAPALAQELRNRVTELQITKDFPIILCSNDSERIRRLKSDETSNDLFDYTFLRDSTLDPKRVSAILLTLVNGYKKIAQSKGDLSKIIERDISEVDDRVFSKFVDKKYPIHEIARHIIHQLIRETGVLIHEEILLARLGLVKNDDSATLIERYFSDCLYQGVFHEGWSRWWMDKVNDKFKDLTKRTFASLDATQRVNLLKKATTLDLADAKPIKLAKSSRFGTICEFTRMPLDIVEGFKLVDEPTLAWQEPRYISLLALAEQVHTDESKGFSLHPSEKQKAESALANL
jgi:hypothetical protein